MVPADQLAATVPYTAPEPTPGDMTMPPAMAGELGNRRRSGSGVRRQRYAHCK